MTQRRFPPPPWSVGQLALCFVGRNYVGQELISVLKSTHVSFPFIYCFLELTPRCPRQRVQRHEGLHVRAIIFPCGVLSIPPQVGYASLMTFAHGANALHISKYLRFDIHNLRWIEVKRGHSPKQKVALFYTNF